MPRRKLVQVQITIEVDDDDIPEDAPVDDLEHPFWTQIDRLEEDIEDHTYAVVRRYRKKTGMDSLSADIANW